MFEEPSTLPLINGHLDHRIPLAFGSDPKNVRPYRYRLNQKDIIEKLVLEILNQSIIQESRSLSISPVVSVGKKDDFWRLCVDYRALNDKTIKDKFPIPVVDELIEELADNFVFSKIDLKYGYHQLRVHNEDVYKTTFKSYNSHYEFLVMLFGLNNALTSFQAWMNHVLNPT